MALGSFRRVPIGAILLLLLTCATACTPAAQPSPEAVLSTSTVVPGAFITLSDPTIRKGVPVTVEFSGPNGFQASYEAYQAEDGSVRVPVPPFFDRSNARFGAGELTAGLAGSAPLVRLQLEDLPPADDTPPGTVMRIVLEDAILELQEAVSGLILIQADTAGAVDVSATTSAMLQQVAVLQNMILRYDATGHFAVPDPAGEIELTDEQMTLADRLLAAWAEGIADEIEQRTAGTALKAVRADRKANQPRIDISVQQRIAYVRSEIRRGLAGSNVLAAGVGLLGTIAVGAGLVASSPGVITVGAVVAVAGAVVSFASGAAGNGNSDAYLQKDPKRFNAGLEAGSQIVRYGSNAASVVPGLGTVATITSLGTGGWDVYSNAAQVKCRKRTPPKRVIDIAQTVDDFCLGLGIEPDANTGSTDGTGDDSGSSDGSDDGSGSDEGDDGSGEPPVSPPPPPPGDCPVPDGARFFTWTSDLDGQVGEIYMMPPDDRVVGPAVRWKDATRTQLVQYSCRDVNGRAQGWVRAWYTTGVLQHEAYYIDGAKDGFERLFTTTGQIVHEAVMANDRINGLCTTWYTDGVRSSEKYYTADVLDGVYRQWYPSGQPLIDGNYEDGLLQGTYRTWDQTGRLTRDCDYDKGVPTTCRVP